MSPRAGSPRAIRPLRDFLHTEAAGGAILAVAAVVALVWANSPWRESYHHLWATQLSLGFGSHHLGWDLHGWVNEALMTVFFFVVGLEVKRELTSGHLADRRAALLPVLAALGGMVMPAVIFVTIVDPAHRHGWGIPMATDIALAVGVVALLSRHVPSGLRAFLLALAVVDDIGAIVVIAIFYGSGTRFGWLGAAVGVVLVAIAGVHFRLRWMWCYVVLALAGWYFLVKAGIHPTLMGVAFGLAAPSFAFTSTTRRRNAGITVVDWLENRFHGWVSYVVIPLFALANAGVAIGVHPLREAITSRLGLAIVVGLVVGKVVGITLVGYLAVHLGWGRLPTGSTRRSFFGVALLAGIGFTVALFVGELAIDNSADLATAKLAVLVASLVAAALGAAVLASNKASGAAPKL